MIRRQDLRKEISKIGHAVLLAHPENLRCHSFTDGVVVDGIKLLNQCGFRDTCVVRNAAVVAKDIGWPIDREGKNAYLVSQCHEQIFRNPQGNEFAAKA